MRRSRKSWRIYKERLSSDCENEKLKTKMVNGVSFTVEMHQIIKKH